jgi:hypothetical protein
MKAVHLQNPVSTKAAAPILGLLLAVAMLGPLAGAADAGTYTVFACRTPDGAAAKPAEWRVNEGPFRSILEVTDHCPNGPYELEMLPIKTHPSYEHLSATVEAPPGTEIEAYKFWRSVQLATSYVYQYRELSTSGYSDFDACSGLSNCFSKGNPAQPFGSANLVQMTGRNGVTGLEFLLTCGLPDDSPEKCPATAPGARLEIFEAELTIADSSSPVIPVAPSGPLVAPGAELSGSEPVTIAATDGGGGVYQGLLEVDGAVVATATLDENGGSCKLPFTSVQPCKPSATGTVSLDTGKLADGSHSLRILVTDATGTNVTAWGPVTIETDNGRCNPAPVSGELDLQVGLAGRKEGKAHVITTRYGRSVRVNGRLLDGSAQPVAGAEVCVAEQTAAGVGTRHPVATRVTDQNGSFSYRVEPGTSRRVYFVNRGAGGAAVDSVAVRVRAPVGLRGSPLSLRNGQTLTMRGQLGSPPFPKRGALVELQAYRETGWQTFGTVDTNRRGRFSFRYTFSRTSGVQHYLLRARVPKQPDYPFESGASDPIKVTVAG